MSPADTTADPSTPTCCPTSEASPCVACATPPPPDRTRRPGNLSPERMAQVATGVMIQRIDDSLGVIQAATLEELADFFPGLGADELGALARSLAVRLVQCAVAAWFPSEFSDDPPADYLDRRREVLLRRAAAERKAGRDAEADHWAAVAASCDIGGELVPPTGILQRVSPDGFAALVRRLKGGPVED